MNPNYNPNFNPNFNPNYNPNFIPNQPQQQPQQNFFPQTQPGQNIDPNFNPNYKPPQNNPMGSNNWSSDQIVNFFQLELKKRDKEIKNLKNELSFMKQQIDVLTKSMQQNVQHQTNIQHQTNPNVPTTMEQKMQNCIFNGICTYQVTQKKYQKQKWYNCLTCNMVNGTGCCESCRNICHSGHNVVESAKSPSQFYCDCGAGGKCLCCQQFL